MTTSHTGTIHKEITLVAPPSRVWRAITDSSEFGTWFGVELEGPFRLGKTIRGRITHPGCEKMIFVAEVEARERERRFAFRWHPLGPEAEGGGGTDGGAEGERNAVAADHAPSTLVEFVLRAAGEGTLLTVSESGFETLPEDRRAQAFQRNEGGWTQQMENIREHVDG